MWKPLCQKLAWKCLINFGYYLVTVAFGYQNNPFIYVHLSQALYHLLPLRSFSLDLILSAKPEISTKRAAVALFSCS